MEQHKVQLDEGVFVHVRAELMELMLPSSLEVGSAAFPLKWCVCRWDGVGFHAAGSWGCHFQIQIQILHQEEPHSATMKFKLAFLHIVHYFNLQCKTTLGLCKSFSTLPCKIS